MNLLEVKNLSFQYQTSEKKALTDINLCIKKNSITAVLGGNGAGKSTLFLNLNGVLTPNKGEIFYRNHPIKSNSKGRKLLREKVGIVFQDPNLQLFSACCRDDIAFGALNQGTAKELVAEKVEAVAKQTGVTPFLDKSTHALSFGQKKRVAIAGVLIMEPEIIVLDEPTAGLDPAGVSELLKLLISIIKDKGTAIVLSTHDIDLIPLYCDYTYVLDQGCMILEGKPEEIFEKKELLRKYNLRLPRLAHLMEILIKEDGLPVNPLAATISGVRKTIKELL